MSPSCPPRRSAALLDPGGEALRVLEIRILAHQCVEHIAPRWVEFGRLPIHPLLYARLGGRFDGQQIANSMLAHQIAANGVGLPQHTVLINEDRKSTRLNSST